MTPQVKYIEPFSMEDGSEPEFHLGKDYEINCAFDLDGDTHLSVVNEVGTIHHFDITEDWFSKSFAVLGDIADVWEEV